MSRHILKLALWGLQFTLVPNWTVQNAIWNTSSAFTVSLSLLKYSDNTLGTFWDTEEERQSLRLRTMNVKCYQATHLGLVGKFAFTLWKCGIKLDANNANNNVRCEWGITEVLHRRPNGLMIVVNCQCCSLLLSKKFYQYKLRLSQEEKGTFNFRRK